MSRIAKKPIPVPNGVSVTLSGHSAIVKGSKASITVAISPVLHVSEQDKQIIVAIKSEEHKANEAANAEHPHKHQTLGVQKKSDMIAGTTRALINNAIIGVSEGFTEKLILNGVGYRAAVQGHSINLTLGYSHPVVFPILPGITAETPTQTEIVLKGHDKALLGQVAANIRALRPPECYKGKGIRYANEVIKLKETKKK